MIELNKILAIVDFRQDQHHALPRAIELAKKYNSKLTVISCIHHKTIEQTGFINSDDREQIKQAYIQHYHSILEALTQEAVDSRVDVKCEIIWEKSFYKGLSAYLKHKDYDLIVKTSHSHSAIEKVLMTPTDWHLMRETNFNILLVKDGKWPNSANILSAINIEADDQDHKALNQKILETSVELSKKFDSDTHLLNVFPWPLVEARQLKHLFDEFGYYDEMLEVHTKELKQYVKDYDIDEKHVHLAEGLDPEEIIPDIVEATKSQLLVIGTVGRKGVAGSLLGNTAEKILDNLHCEVLALRP